MVTRAMGVFMSDSMAATNAFLPSGSAPLSVVATARMRSRALAARPSPPQLNLHGRPVVREEEEVTLDVPVPQRGSPLQSG